MPGYGRQILSASAVAPTRVSADGNPQYKPGGVTLDLATIPAASGSDITLPDGSVIKANTQYLRYGQVLVKITIGTTQTATITGTPTGGTFVMQINGQNTSALAHNVTAAAMQAALELLSTVGPGKVVVTGTAPYSIAFHADLGTVPIWVLAANNLTGGTTPTVVPAVTVPGLSAGKFGPYDAAMSDGRQTLDASRRGEAFILDETWFYYPSGSPILSGSQDVIGGVFDTGLVFKDRIVQSGIVTGSLALGPTLANLNLAFPGLRYTQN
jgi:hypothetical protein